MLNEECLITDDMLANIEYEIPEPAISDEEMEASQRRFCDIIKKQQGENL